MPSLRSQFPHRFSHQFGYSNKDNNASCFSGGSLRIKHGTFGIGIFIVISIQA